MEKLVVGMIVAFIIAVAFRVIEKVDVSKKIKNTIIRKWLNKLKEDAKFVSEVGISIVGIGVTILLTRYDLNLQDKETTISLLLALDNEVSVMEEKVEENYIEFGKGLEVLNGGEVFKFYYSCVPIQPLYSLDIVLENETVITTMKPHTYCELIEIRNTLSIIQGKLDNIGDLSDAEVIQEVLSELELLTESYSDIRSLAQAEIESQK